MAAATRCQQVARLPNLFLDKLNQQSTAWMCLKNDLINLFFDLEIIFNVANNINV